MNYPLGGVRVLDLSQVVAGPYGASLLGQLGASVLKVESLKGEDGRTLPSIFYALNTGKRSIALNLQLAEGRDILRRLTSEYDVLIENFRPGVMRRLDADYESLSAVNPRLIYVSITAFGNSGPYAHRPGFDPLLQALTGLERAQGGLHHPPVFLRLPVIDLATGMQQAGAITMALYNREITGRGCHLNLSLLRTGVFVNAEAFVRMVDGERPLTAEPDGGQHGLGPLDRMYQCANGWIFLVVEDSSGWERLVGLPSFGRLAGDPALSSTVLRRKNRALLAQRLEAIFLTDTLENWLSQLELAGVPCAPVVVGYERRFFEDVQPIANGYVVQSHDTEWGRAEHPGNFLRFSDSYLYRDVAAAPRAGQDTEQVLLELGYKEREIVSLRYLGVIR